MLRRLVKNILGPANLGRLDYVLRPRLRDSWGGPFNNQHHRRRIYSELLSTFPFEAIIETGTYRGTTAALFASSGLPLYTVESNPRYHAFSRLRFRSTPNVHLVLGDSRAALERWAGDPSVPKSDVFVYLDAHWEPEADVFGYLDARSGENVPLRDEVRIVFSNWRRAVVMVDDFEVPDSEYRFDSYGPTQTLNLNYLAAVISDMGITPFFPSVSAAEESGAKRGAVVLCNDGETSERLNGIGSLRRAVRLP